VKSCIKIVPRMNKKCFLLTKQEGLTIAVVKGRGIQIWNKVGVGESIATIASFLAAGIRSKLRGGHMDENLT
jgi:hypothetical protein